MSVACCIPVVECVYCLACVRWAWKKFLYTAGRESENWGLATASEFEPIARLCRYVVAVYEDDLRNPIWEPLGGYGMNPDWVILKKDYDVTLGKVPPYMIYLDHENLDIVLTVRGLRLDKESDFLLLLDNKLGQTKFDNGYVHNGLLKAAQWVFDEECEVLKKLVEENADYTLTFVGHSLGAGVVTCLTMLAVKNRDKLGRIERNKIRCFAIAPARCVSLNLAVRYADVINSIVLQDDFLPRTTVALEDAFKSLFCFPCLMCILCLKDTCVLDEKKIKDPRRLYAPGRLYHIVSRKSLSLGGTPSPVVRTAVPVDGRFEHMVLSCNMTKDHRILRIMEESERALHSLMERDKIMDIPKEQRMERQATIAKEHMNELMEALQRAIALDVPEAYSPTSTYGTFEEFTQGENSGMRPSFISNRNREFDAILAEMESGDDNAVVKKS